MAGTSPGFPALRALSGGSDLPADRPEAASFEPMSSSPTLPSSTEAPRLAREPSALPSLTAQSDLRVQAAIAASTRAEASLSGLFRAIQHLGSGVGGAREANELLMHELEALRDTLGAANEQQLLSKQKIFTLEQALDRARNDEESGRQFLIEQQDAFIVDLLDEQEGELARRDQELEMLRERLAEVERRSLETVPPPNVNARVSARVPAALAAVVDDDTLAFDRAERAELERTTQKLAEDRERARETVRRLQTQRDEAQSAVTRITQERDEALQQIHRLKSELGGPRIPPSTRPPAVEPRKPDLASVRPPGVVTPQLNLDPVELGSPVGDPKVSSPQLRVPSSSSASAALRPTEPGPPISSVMSPPRSNPLAAPMLPRFSPPPQQLRSTLTSSPALQPLASSSRPPLRQKPDASTRPLVGYSLNDDSVEAEQLEGVRLSKPPPSRDKR